MGSQCCGTNPKFRDLTDARAQLAQLQLNEKEVQMLHLIYTDLAERVNQKAITLQNFVLFFHKNGFWGQRLFKQFDSTQSNLIVQNQFIIGITKLFKTNQEKKIELLFKFFAHSGKKKLQQKNQKISDSTNQSSQGVSFQNFLIMLYNYPKEDLKKVLNDKQFFQKQLRGSLRLIGQNRRLQSVYKMGSYIQRKKSVQCQFDQKSQGSDGGTQKSSSSEQVPSIGSMIGRNILKSLKQNKAEQTTVKFQDEGHTIQIKTNNFHHLVKKFALRMWKDLKIDIKTQKMNQSQFYNWTLKHKKLYDSYFSGFHNEVWQLEESTQQPMYMSRVFQMRSQCKFCHPHHAHHNKKFQKAEAILLHLIIIITHQKQLSKPIEVICLEGLAVTKTIDKELGLGIAITHREGIYEKRQIFFENEKITDEWLEALKFFKGQSIEDLYTMTKKIGAGRFSVVYQGIYKKTGKKYAIKVIESYKLEQDQKDLISHQTNIMKVFSHPLLVQFKESIQTKTHLYIIAELCVGKDLFQFVKDSGCLSQIDAAIITQQMIVGLRYMHSLGIVHRDLKPENIMVSYHNDKIDKIKIIDFGFANYLDKLQELAPQQNLAGTPNYIAPQVLRRQTITFKIDIFALGAILYYVLSTALPFNDFSLTQIFNKTLDGHYQFPQNKWKHISKDAKDLISKLLMNEPEQRINLEDALNHPWFNRVRINNKEQIKDKHTIISNNNQFSNK